MDLVKILESRSQTGFQRLRIPPGNRLERLTGDRRGQYSIRVNAQWRLCFTWHEGGADDVELVDYH
nr:type II toxin-antitoxin system RelE/ParE family toxin [Actinomyces sp. HMSC08A09]